MHTATIVPEADRERSSSPWQQRAIAAAVVLLGLIAYGNALQDTFVGLDTIINVRDNPDIRSITPLQRSLALHRTGAAAEADASTFVRRPLLSFSFALNSVFSAGRPADFQVVNILIHLLNGLLLYGIARRTLEIRQRSRFESSAIAGVIAAIWIVHPLHTESVTNIIQRAESLAGFFSLLTLYAAIRSWQAPAARRVWGWRLASVVSCTAGMLTKEIVIVVPVLVWLYDSLFVSKGYFAALRRAPAFYLGLAASSLALIAMVSVTLSNTAYEFDRNRLPNYILSQPRVLVHYLYLAFWPRSLFHYIFGQPFRFDRARDSWLAWMVSATPVVIALAATAWLAVRRRPIAFLGAAFFLPLLPTSLLSTFTIIQEHRMYLPLAAVVAGTVLAGDRWLRSFELDSHRRYRRRVALALTAVAVFALILRTHDRNRDYGSELTFWASDDVPVAYAMMLHHSWVVRRDLDEASQRLRELLQSPSVDFSNQPAIRGRAAAHNALGAIEASRHHYAEARKQWLHALESDPQMAAAANNLAVVAAIDGETGEARQRLAAALAMTPQDPIIHFNAAVVALRSGDRDAARRHLDAARAGGDTHADEVDPSSALARVPRLTFRIEEPKSLGFNLKLRLTDAPESGGDLDGRGVGQ